jgi:hypothetical protein
MQASCAATARRSSAGGHARALAEEGLREGREAAGCGRQGEEAATHLAKDVHC